jgi:hypothetical protein
MAYDGQDEFATSVNNRVMNRKVTERLVGVALMGSLESAGDFALPLGATKSPML